jgi:hypothetical protein
MNSTELTYPDELEARRIAGVVVKDLYGMSVVPRW